MVFSSRYGARRSLDRRRDRRHVTQPDPYIRLAFANRFPERLRFVFTIAGTERDPFERLSTILGQRAGRDENRREQK